jgi:hypothetical protein
MRRPASDGKSRRCRRGAGFGERQIGASLPTVTDLRSHGTRDPPFGAVARVATSECPGRTRTGDRRGWRRSVMPMRARLPGLLTTGVRALRGRRWRRCRCRWSAQLRRARRRGLGLGLFVELILHAGEPVQGVLRGGQRGGESDQPCGRSLPARAGVDSRAASHSVRKRPFAIMARWFARLGPGHPLAPAGARPIKSLHA